MFGFRFDFDHHIDALRIEAGKQKCDSGEAKWDKKIILSISFVLNFSFVRFDFALSWRSSSTSGTTYVSLYLPYSVSTMYEMCYGSHVRNENKFIFDLCNWRSSFASVDLSHFVRASWQIANTAGNRIIVFGFSCSSPFNCLRMKNAYVLRSISQKNMT